MVVAFQGDYNFVYKFVHFSLQSMCPKTPASYLPSCFSPSLLR